MEQNFVLSAGERLPEERFYRIETRNNVTMFFSDISSVLDYIEKEVRGTAGDIIRVTFRTELDIIFHMGRVHFRIPLTSEEQEGVRRELLSRMRKRFEEKIRIAREKI